LLAPERFSIGGFNPFVIVDIEAYIAIAHGIAPVAWAVRTAGDALNFISAQLRGIL
jgi:hypothetical protein